MTKIIIEQTLRQAITAGNLHFHAIQGGNENKFTQAMGAFVLNLFPQVQVPNPFGGNEVIDLIEYNNPEEEFNEVAIEAKHYTPHQNATLPNYLNYSLSGPIKDVLKLVDCGFEKFYILQLQTHITGFNLLGGASYAQLKKVFPLFGYLSLINVAEANANIHRIIMQNRIEELEDLSRQKLDLYLFCDHLPTTIHTTIADIDVIVHYLISGPFYRRDLLPRIQDQLGPDGPYERKVGGPGQIPAMDIDISIVTTPFD
jgi:hypothetical protein